MVPNTKYCHIADHLQWPTMAQEGCILYENPDTTIALIDVPRSIELAQGGGHGKLVSSEPLRQPYPSMEPKTANARERLGEASIQDLLLQKYIHFALNEVREAVRKPWCLNRVTKPLSDQRPQNELSNYEMKNQNQMAEEATDGIFQLHHNPEDSQVQITLPGCTAPVILPPRSTCLQGTVQDTLQTFLSSAPAFDLMLLDPPWPNRSALRSSSYTTPCTTSQIRALLSSIPVLAHLASNGILAIWLTNKSAFHDLLLEPGGLFEEWGVELVEEWMWVKVTEHGEPIVGLESRWRKSWEVLLVARKAGNDLGEGEERGEVKRRIIFGVPDLHSRKPNLKGMFERMLGKEGESYDALEVFARNLTAGWWAWGDEVLTFQSLEHWVLPP